MPFFHRQVRSWEHRYDEVRPPVSLTGRDVTLLTEIEYTADEVEFGAAMEKYMRTRCRRHPSYCEVLAVARALGYRKVE